MLHPNFNYLTLLLILVGDFSYLRDTLKGRVKPNRVSWLLWGLIPVIIYFAQLSKDVKFESVVTLVLGLTPILIFFATFLNKKSVWMLTGFDWACGALSGLGILAWYISKDGNYAIAFSMIAQFFASIPTIKKSYTNPETESYMVYLLNCIAMGVALFTVKDWKFANYGYLLYTLLSCMLEVILIKFELGKKIKL